MKKIISNIFLFIQSILVFVLLVMTWVGIKEDIFISIINLVILVFVSLYGTFLYIKPHGNMLKYAMLLFSANIVISDSLYLYNSAELSTDTVVLVVVQMVAAIIIAYCSGRLNRINANKIFFAVVLLMLIVPAIIFSIQVIVDGISPTYILKAFYQTILFITLMIAYFTRYKEHKESGLEDAPTAK